MPLTDVKIRQTKAGDKPMKLTDGGGLYLLVNTKGKYWRWDLWRPPALIDHAIADLRITPVKYIISAASENRGE